MLDKDEIAGVVKRLTGIHKRMTHKEDSWLMAAVIARLQTITGIDEISSLAVDAPRDEIICGLVEALERMHIYAQICKGDRLIAEEPEDFWRGWANGIGISGQTVKQECERYLAAVPARYRKDIL